MFSKLKGFFTHSDTFSNTISRTKKSEKKLINDYETMDHALKSYQIAYKKHLANLMVLDDFVNFNGMQRIFKDIILKKTFTHGNVDLSNPLLFKNYLLSDNITPKEFRKIHIIQQVQYVLKKYFAIREHQFIKEITAEVGKHSALLTITTIENKKKECEIEYSNEKAFILKMKKVKSALKHIISKTKKHLKANEKMIFISDKDSAINTDSSKRKKHKSNKLSALNSISKSSNSSDNSGDSGYNGDSEPSSASSASTINVKSIDNNLNKLSTRSKKNVVSAKNLNNNKHNNKHTSKHTSKRNNNERSSIVDLKSHFSSKSHKTNKKRGSNSGFNSDSSNTVPISRFLSPKKTVPVANNMNGTTGIPGQQTLTPGQQTCETIIDPTICKANAQCYYTPYNKCITSNRPPRPQFPGQVLPGQPFPGQTFPGGLVTPGIQGLPGSPGLFQGAQIQSPMFAKGPPNNAQEKL